MKRTVIAICLGILASTGVAGAATYTIDPVHSDVSFKIRHLITKVPGEFSSFEGTIVTDFDNLERSSVNFTIDAASIDTGNDDRDTHLRSQDFFHVEAHPTITFRSTKIERSGEATFDVTGILTMRGVSKAVTLPVTYLGEMTDPWGNTKAGFAIETTLDRTDYDIQWNKALEAGGVVLGDDVEITINLQATKE
ncbi:MAG: YceI family protein [Holophagae bacterium]|jgi:polyisoprenoid-binding protein YceI